MITPAKPEKNFLPSPGTLTRFRFPAETRQLRIDTGFREGDTITPFYDPMIAKIIVVGENRDQVIEKMATALEKIN